MSHSLFKKNMIVSDLILTHYFNPRMPLVLACDASACGLGAVLSHTSDKNCDSCRLVKRDPKLTPVHFHEPRSDMKGRHTINYKVWIPLNRNCCRVHKCLLISYGTHLPSVLTNNGEIRLQKCLSM